MHTTYTNAGAGCTPNNYTGWGYPTNYSDTGLSCNTTYGYRVRAYDDSSSFSGYSSAAYATTSACAPTPAPVVTISANPSTILLDGSSTISWSATNNPTNCVLTGVGGVAAVGNKVVYPSTTTTYTLTCTGAGGTGSGQTTVNVQPSTIISKPTANTGWSFLPVCSDLASMDKFCKSNGYGSGESSGVAYSGGACAKWIDSSWTSSSDTLYDAKCYNPSPPVAYSLGSSLTANALGALDNAKNSEKKSQTNLNITNTQTPSCAEFTVTLSKGMNNAEVKCLQKS